MPGGARAALKHHVVPLVETAARTALSRLGRLPRGVDPGHDVRVAFPGYEPDVVVDVGAMVGDYTAKLLRWFPKAHAYAFEPVPTSFEQLMQRFDADERVSCYRIAIGATNGEAVVALDVEDPSRSTTSPAEASVGTGDADRVELRRLDRISTDLGIERVGFAKIDTEGGDLDVVTGADALLTERRIDFVQVEAGVDPANDFHVPIELLKSELEAKGYKLFAVYEQMAEWTRQEPQLRRVDAVFVSPKLIQSGSQRQERG